MFPCLCDVIYCTRRENNTGFAFTGSTRQVAVCTAANTRFTRGVDEWNLPHPTFLLSLLLLFRQEVGGNETGNTPSSLRWVRYAKSICFSTRIGDESSNLCELPPCFALLRQRNRAFFRFSKNRRRQEGEKPEGNEEKKSTSSSREFRLLLLLLDLPTYLHTHTANPSSSQKVFYPPQDGRTDGEGGLPFYQFRREKGRKRNRQEG